MRSLRGAQLAAMLAAGSAPDPEQLAPPIDPTPPPEPRRKASDATPHRRRAFRLTVDQVVSPGMRCAKHKVRAKRLRRTVNGRKVKVWVCLRCERGAA